MSEHLTVASLSRLDRGAFVAAVGAVFEHSPWVMERAWAKRPFANRAALHGALAAVLAEAGYAELLALINAHPELAGKAAVRGDLTADSAREQAGAGLDLCTPEEFASLQHLNAAYRAKFGWPFIVAVKGLSRQGIIGEMARRLARPAADEFAEALGQIQRIASFRLDDLLRGE
ncbi:MAG: decarboxylase [Proteobacteria bacterium]|nr:decarboxylase [Pseudomonadota bacterium]